ncbi:DUF4398 domain-containing protein [Pseudomonas sp. P9_35]|uniref:DUF4398 domain-containing protein n=1 Tax=unclassified Pseudomonas TaxID=196821 RepID=UPI002A36A02A|nr:MULTISPECIES: DUF4398 domain-containing protein [unclassified Pseudomonas]WPN65655.1 DUF4398 domain-containing protein [Pseudomonas sp. P9_32]WPN71406.1 DUF4398 domain-containing protein [Pseudomonas sp. P9_35]
MYFQPVYRRALRGTFLASALVTIGACAELPLPDQQMSMSRDAVNRAVSAEATQYAPLEMKSAQDKLFQMERAAGERNAVAARLLAEQAEVDANLAERKAYAAKQAQLLKQSKNGIQVLKKEMLENPDSVTGFSPTDSH